MRLWAVLFCVMLTSALGAQSSVVALLVTDYATTAPLPDVEVSIADRSAGGVTDSHGRFVFTASRPGKVVVTLRRIGYAQGTVRIDVTREDTTRVTFGLTAVPLWLAPVDVRDTLTSVSPVLAGFERRAASRAGSASYITRTEIDQRKPSRVTDLLRRVTSVKIIDSAGVLTAVSSRLQKPVIGPGINDLAPCTLRVAIDGQLTEAGFAVNTLPPEQVHGIEIYPGPATIPAEYASMRRDAACGLIMIWTRRDR